MIRLRNRQRLRERNLCYLSQIDLYEELKEIKSMIYKIFQKLNENDNR